VFGDNYAADADSNRSVLSMLSLCQSLDLLCATLLVLVLQMPLDLLLKCDSHTQLHGTVL